MAAAIPAIVLGLLLAGTILQPTAVGVKNDWRNDGNRANVRIYVGQWHNEAYDNMGGNIPSVTLWDSNGDYWGAKRASGKIPHGGFLDIPVAAVHGNRRSSYISLTSTGSDAICVAGVTVTHPEGITDVWTGDLGYTCHFPWYFSDRPIGTSKKAPKCVWIDGDNSVRKDHPEDNKDFPQGLSYHIDDMTPTEKRGQQYSLLPESLCGNPARMATHLKANLWTPIDVFLPPLQYKEDGTDVNLEQILANKGIRPSGKVKRSLSQAMPERMGELRRYLSRKTRRQETQSLFDGRLVRSSNQSAIELCESPTSMGPDFVSLEEQIFCDMKTRMTWPVCNDTLLGGCFHAEQARFVAGGAMNVSHANVSMLAASSASLPGSLTNLGAASLPVKSYHSVVNAM